MKPRNFVEQDVVLNVLHKNIKTYSVGMEASKITFKTLTQGSKYFFPFTRMTWLVQ